MIRSFIPLFRAVTTAPVFGAVTVIPMPLQAICVPALTLGISAVEPMTLIVWGVDPLYASVAPPPPPFFPEPHPATVKPRTASNASARIGFTAPRYTPPTPLLPRPFGGHSGTLAQRSLLTPEGALGS